MEEEIFPRPAVRRVLTEKFVEARLHTDHPEHGEKWIALERGYIGYHAQAHYVLVDPATRKKLRSINFSLDFRDDEQLFVRFLLGE